MSGGDYVRGEDRMRRGDVLQIANVLWTRPVLGQIRAIRDEGRVVEVFGRGEVLEVEGVGEGLDEL